jgi:hypothetical protein
MDFISREEYLAERHHWKKAYMSLSKDIHALKVATKAAAKGGWAAARTLQSLRARSSNHAFDMMLDLEDLKQQSRMTVGFQRFLDTSNYYYQPR